MGKSTKTSSSSQLDPAQRAMLTDLYGRATRVADQPFQAYDGQTLAGFTNPQLAAQGMTMAGALGNVGGSTLNQAIGGTARAMNFNPMQVTGQGYNPAMMQAANAGPAALTGTANAGPGAMMQAADMSRDGVRNINGGSFLNQNIGAYMNPFTGEVIDRTMADMDRARQMQMNQGAASASAAGAFGGSRHGVVDALTNSEFFRNAGNMAAGLRSQAFDNATGLAGQDLARGLQAQMANQGMDFSVGSLNAGFQQGANASNQAALNNMAQFNAGLGQQSMLANQAALNNMGQFNAGLAQQAGANNQASANAAGQFNAGALNAAQLANQGAGLAGAQLNLGAASQLAGLSDQQRQQFFGNAAMMEAVGGQQQAMNQAQLDDAYARWLEAQNYNMNQVGFLGSIVNGMPSFGGTTTGRSTPSTMSQIGMALGNIGGLLGMGR